MKANDISVGDPDAIAPEYDSLWGKIVRDAHYGGILNKVIESDSGDFIWAVALDEIMRSPNGELCVMP